MKNWSAQKNNIQIIVATAFIILIAGGGWGMIDHQRGFLHQLTENRLQDYSLAFWDSVTAQAQELKQIAKQQHDALRDAKSGNIKAQLKSSFDDLKQSKNIDHIGYFTKDKSLVGLVDKDGMHSQRDHLQLLKLSGQPSVWGLEVTQSGELILCIRHELRINGQTQGYLEIGRSTSKQMLHLAQQHQIFSLIITPNRARAPSALEGNIEFAELTNTQINVVHSDFSDINKIELEQEDEWSKNIKELRFRYQGREYQGSLRKVFDTKGQIVMLHMAAIDISDLMLEHKRKLSIFLAMALLSFALLGYVVIHYLRAVERDLHNTYASLAEQIDQRKLTEAQLIEAKEGLEQGIAERTEALSQLNQKLRDDLKTRYSMQQALMVSERQYRTLFDHSSDAMILLEDNRPSLCNTAAVELLKLNNHSDIKNIDLIDLLFEDKDNHNDRLRRQFVRFQRSDHYGQPLKREWRCKDLSGRSFFADITLSKIPSEDKRRIAHLTIRDITEKKEAELKIANQAYYDSLTKLPNRNLLMDRLQQATVSAGRSNCYGAVMFMDLDNFKYINDSLGHAVGDTVLVEVAKRLRAAARADDTIARFGGDEFVVLIPATFSNKQRATINAQKIAEKMRDIFTTAITHHTQQFHLTPSIGVTLFNSEKIPTSDILKHADTAMYQAKSIGKNAICFFEQDMQQRIEHRLHLESKMREAIKAQAFELRFQPKFDHLGRVIGAETLCRWQLCEGQWISPAEFIPIAEETGMINELGSWVFDTALVTLRTIKQHVKMPFTMAINVSPLQMNQHDIVRQLLNSCARYDIAPRDVTLEITETLLMQDAESTEQKLRRLKSHGFQISIDDFGTGYSSLAYLKHLSIDELKIDRSFVADIGQDPDDDSIVQVIIALSQHLKLTVVAEGVETQAQLEFLQHHQCGQYQGYYFSHPLTESELLELVSVQASTPNDLVSIQ